MTHHRYYLTSGEAKDDKRIETPNVRHAVRLMSYGWRLERVEEEPEETC